MEHHFFEGWHRYYREPVGVLSEEQARMRHDRGDEYVVVLGRPERPNCFIEIRGEVFGVSFLDEQQREYLMYTFEKVDAQRLFLKEVIHRTFKGDSAEVINGAAYRFSADGTLQIENAAQPFEKSIVREGNADVTLNWEPVPNFGDYASLINKERVKDLISYG